MHFVDRRLELSILDDLYQRPGAQFLVLYGRRRVGKTRLLTWWLERLVGSEPGPSPGDRGRHIYWMATQTSATNQLRGFSQAVLALVAPGAHVDPSFSFATWEVAFAEAGRAARDQRLVLILDEFTYVMQANTEVPSLLQRAWDHGLKEQSQLFIILAGSHAGIIQRQVLDYQAPLYGRATGRICLQPLPFGAMREILPRHTPEQRVAVYAITGGVPAYIELFDDRLNITENLRQRIVSPANLMLRDAVFLLHEQFDEPRNYAAIIEAIANGSHTPTDIARMAGVDRSNLGKYLGVLQELGYVARQVSATVHRPEQSRKGRYVVTDAYLRFYYRFLAPSLGLIERGMIEPAIALLTDHLIDFIGTHTFEELCRDWLAVQAETGRLPFLPERIGSHWSSKAQVDVVAINWRTKDVLLGECKWGMGQVGRAVVRGLVDKTAPVLPEGDWRVHYAFFARQGFTEAARAEAAGVGALLVTLGEMEEMEEGLGEWAEGGRSCD